MNKPTVAFLGDSPLVAGNIIRRLGWRKTRDRKCDVLWVLDAAEAKKVADYRYRVLVFDDFLPDTPEREAGRLILKFIADLILNGEVKKFHRRANLLDQLVVDELVDEILEKLEAEHAVAVS